MDILPISALSSTFLLARKIGDCYRYIRPLLSALGGQRTEAKHHHEPSTPPSWQCVPRRLERTHEVAEKNRRRDQTRFRLGDPDPSLHELQDRGIDGAADFYCRGERNQLSVEIDVGRRAAPTIGLES